MFDKFLQYFQEDIDVKKSDDLYRDFILQLGDRSFGNGLFRSFSDVNLEKWSSIVRNAFPYFEDKFRLFGYDWLGRCFGVDLRTESCGQIVLFEIGTNDVLEIPCSLEQFLDEEIPTYADACLAQTFFGEWLAYSKQSIKKDRCIGYKIPLFLGGEDVISNLEDCDMEVYWNVMTQIKAKL